MKLNLSTFLLLLTFTGMAQVNIVNRSLTNDTLAILYTGIDNEIEIVGYSMKPKTSIGIINGTISNLNSTTYLVRVNTGPRATITIKEKNKTICSREFEVREISDPVARIGDIIDTVATVQQIQASGMIKVDFPNCFYRGNATINSFNLRVAKGNSLIDLKSSHYIFSPEITKAIGELAPGDVLFFDKIRMTQPGGRSLNLAPLTIRII